MNMYKRITLLTLCGLVLIQGIAMAEPAAEMISVKGGCFQMGDSTDISQSNEKPAHEVCVNDFQIGKQEVTQAQWKSVMNNNPSKFPGDDRPVDQVTWDDAQKFITKLNAQTGKRFRLPTEAEWEYAARSGGKVEKWAGTGEEGKLSEYCWFYQNSNNETHPVSTKKPNGLGLFDMCGNVAEWVQDNYSEDWYKESPRDNPQGPTTGSDHILRGGSWYDSPKSLRTTNRSWKIRNIIERSTTGIRLAM